MKNKNGIPIFILGMAILIDNVQNVKAQWEQVKGPETGKILSFCMMDSTIFAGTEKLGIIASTDSGANWMMVNNEAGAINVLSLAKAGDTLYAGTSSGVAMLVTGNGTNWNTTNVVSTMNEVQSLALNGGDVFAGTFSNGVFLSTNNGRSWSAINSGLKGLWVSSFLSIGNNILAGTDSGVYMFARNGAKWSDANAGLTNRYITSLAVYGSTIFCGTNDGIFISTDSGTNWTSTHSLLDPLGVNSFAVNDRAMFAGNMSDVFLSNDTGKIWERINPGIGFEFNISWVGSLAIYHGYIFVGTWREGIVRCHLSDFTGTIEKPAHGSSNSTTFRMFSPKVSGQKATIAFSAATRQRVHLTVYNSSGIAVQTLDYKQFEPGLHIISWNVGSLAPGCYVLRMRTGAINCAKSIMLVR